MRIAVPAITLALIAVGVPTPAHAETTYTVTELGGGTSSAGSSINNEGLVAGYANNDGLIEATVWRDGSPTGLGTLGGPNSAVLWPVKNESGIVVGVAETTELDPRGEEWSCSFFFPTVTGHVCRGFVWRDGRMTPLPTLGGTHGFATGANNKGQVVGWAETDVEDPTCVAPQVLGFLAAVWNARGQLVGKLLPLPGDHASAATAINARGQVVGISGDCATSVGGYTARNAVLWENGTPTNIGNFGGVAWNTPMAINDAGTVVGFANSAQAVGDAFDYRAFVWTRNGGFRPLTALPGDTRSQALSVNNDGQVVGLSRGPAGVRAALWRDGVPVNLNDLVDYDGHLLYANDINDDGVMTGLAINAAGKAVAFVATPSDAGR